MRLSKTACSFAAVILAFAAGAANAQDWEKDYANQMQSLIKKNWAPPKLKENTRVKVAFLVNRDGKVSNIKIVKSSGDQITDKAAITAVRTASPLPALPPQEKKNNAEMAMTFDYNTTAH